MKVNTKHLLPILVLVLIVVFPTACRYHGGPDVKGSGVRQTQKRDVPAFTSISSEGAFDIEVVCQKEQSLEIEADDNILPLITTEVRGNVLHIKPTQNYSMEDSIVVKITVPNLEGIDASGAGKFEVTGMKNDKFALDVSGAPVINVSGETKSLTIEANGAGKIDAHNLRATEADVETNGVSTVELHATDRLDVTISGPSHVIYEGNPDVNETINGPGKLEKRESEGA
jgi:hypothetical protein